MRSVSAASWRMRSRKQKPIPVAPALLVKIQCLAPLECAHTNKDWGRKRVRLSHLGIRRSAGWVRYCQNIHEVTSKSATHDPLLTELWTHGVIPQILEIFLLGFTVKRNVFLHSWLYSHSYHFFYLFLNKGTVSPIIPSAPKCSSRHFVFHRKCLCFE